MKLSRKISGSHELKVTIDHFHYYYNEMRERSREHTYFDSPEEDPSIVLIGKMLYAIETLETDVKKLEKELQDLKNRVEC